jgi:hypothetical protein
LILKLNPLEDPMGSLLLIDHVSILSKNYSWLEGFILNFSDQYIAKGTSLLLYPNFIFSFAICLLEKQFPEIEDD